MKFRVLLLCLALPGCFDTDLGGGSTVIATVVALRPAEFLKSVPCAEGSVERYVATFTDVTGAGDADAAAPFELPSSGPTSCHQAVGTALAVPGHQYIAHVAAYDRADIAPLTPGSPIMVATDGRVVEPRWVGDCSEPVYSVEFATQYVRCSPLTPVSDASLTQP
jgi:hypothetical protein